LNRGLDKAAALRITTGQVGTALAASALTTIFGLGMMYFADFGKFRYSGPVIAVCLAVCLLACLTLAPALLQGLGRLVFWPFSVSGANRVRLEGRRSAGLERFWAALSGTIIQRPGLILVASLALMIYPAIEGWSVPISYNLVNELQPSRASVVGTKMFRRHFPPGDTGPLTIVACQQGVDFDSKQGEWQIATLTKMIYETDGVDSVRSFAEPLGDRPGLFNPLSRQGRRKMAAKRHPRTITTY
jgi:RND superfamily putative drug exporter